MKPLQHKLGAPKRVKKSLSPAEAIRLHWPKTPKTNHKLR